jgi:predicted CopG family antitoxin
MRKVSFEVPSEVIGDFTEKLTELELANSIIGKTEDDEIEVEVYYEKSESKQVDDLEEYLEELIDNLGEDDEDEDEDK